MSLVKWHFLISDYLTEKNLENFTSQTRSRENCFIFPKLEKKIYNVTNLENRERLLYLHWRNAISNIHIDYTATFLHLLLVSWKKNEFILGLSDQMRTKNILHLITSLWHQMPQT